MSKIEKYVGYFHDGELLGIKHEHDVIELFLSSAQVDREEVPDLHLTRNYLKGTLILRHVKKIEDYKNNIIDSLKMVTEIAGILDLEIERLQDNLIEVELNVRWYESKKHRHRLDYSGIKITCEEISWEPYIARKRKLKKS